MGVLRVDPPGPPGPPAPSGSERSESPAGSLVLVVEDETVLRATMVRALHRVPGIEVIDTATLREASELIRALKPNLLVTDLDLPDGSGVELIAQLERRRPVIPVIVVSAYVGRFRAQLTGHSHVEVHDKPLPLVELRERVQARLGVDPGASALPFTAADYIQLACQGRHSVVIVLQQSGTPLGRIVVADGEVWSAEDRLGRGDAALRRLLFDDGVSIDVRSLAPGQAGTRSLFGAWQALLLEAARLHDEAARVRARTRSEAAVPAVPPRQPRAAEAEVPAPLPPPPLPPVAKSAGGARAVDEPALSRRFEELYDQSVDALLSKRYVEAYQSFLAASALRPDDPRVAANLRRLRELGHGGPT